MIRSLFLLVLLASACTPDLEGTVEIHALPIGLEIIYPITPVNIVEMNSCTGQAEATDPRIQEVMTLLDGAGPGSFYAATTRVRMRDTTGATIYIDNYGGVRRSSQESALDETALRRVDDLLHALTSSCVSAEYLWAVEASHAHIANEKEWARSDYAILSATLVPKWRGPTVVVKVRHNDDVALLNLPDDALTAGGGKSFELHFDAEAREFLGEYRYQ